ncbi:2-Methylisocitrate lyase, PEP mutase family [Devosia sp. YR412]|uniref:isocitrate lyase/PEP mutase family protein n=1 Tax=Devosia sp. YR412 TaxID=1881030 RepID=UPI0008B8CF88|nr:isocitrate lyase/PEP mutase family protein [Devosia sp. YR412]SEQ49080.1 2-Methylisocitrate lyase, PEP mutase family [Devosia sp. YR412]
MTSQAARLKSILARREAVIMPGTPNALFANVIQELGYECAYITGAGVTNMYLGSPDVGLITMSEMVQHIAVIAEAVDIPLLVDGDTGFGNPVNTYRTVRAYERAGAAGIQIEDQDFPKKCGHFNGKAVIPTDEMVQKIKAAVDSRRDQDFQIIARTDAIAVNGIEDAMDRAHRYIEAGADVTFVEAPTGLDDIARISRELPVPQIFNYVFGGKTPPVEQTMLKDMGYGAGLYANAALQAALLSVHNVLGELQRTGSLASVKDELASFEMRQSSVRKHDFDSMEKRYT